MAVVWCCRGKGLFTVKGDVGFMGRDLPRSCLQLLRCEQTAPGPEAARALGRRRKGAVEKEVKLSRRHRSYLKAQEVARRQEQAVSLCHIHSHSHIVAYCTACWASANTTFLSLWLKKCGGEAIRVLMSVTTLSCHVLSCLSCAVMCCLLLCSICCAFQNAEAAKALGNQMDLKWRLIYEGNATEYTVQNLVPQHVVDTEPSAAARVQFCLRTVGADFPLESYSLQSQVSEFSTARTNQGLRAAQQPLNRSRKEVICTSLEGYGDIKMERWNGNVYSEGVCDAYV